MLRRSSRSIGWASPLSVTITLSPPASSPTRITSAPSVPSTSATCPNASRPKNGLRSTPAKSRRISSDSTGPNCGWFGVAHCRFLRCQCQVPMSGASVGDERAVPTPPLGRFYRPEDLFPRNSGERATPRSATRSGRERAGAKPETTRLAPNSRGRKPVGLHRGKGSSARRCHGRPDAPGGTGATSIRAIVERHHVHRRHAVALPGAELNGRRLQAVSPAPPRRSAGGPCASSAVIAAANTHPLPWLRPAGSSSAGSRRRPCRRGRRRPTAPRRAAPSRRAAAAPARRSIGGRRRGRRRACGSTPARGRQHLGLPQVRRHDRCDRHKPPADRRHHLRRHQHVPALGDHHRVTDVGPGGCGRCCRARPRPRRRSATCRSSSRRRRGPGPPCRFGGARGRRRFPPPARRACPAP